MAIQILLGVALVVFAFIVFVGMRPARFHVERSAAIGAPAAVPHAQVDDHRKFAVWNPFLKLDPAVKNTFSGPPSGVGSKCSWEGNRDIGAGSSTIIESRPGELVRQRMDWIRPMAGTSTVDFTFKPEGGKTVVTWAMYGEHGFMGKAFSLFVDMDKMCGTQFEQGLADLAKAVGAAPAK